MGGTQQSLVHRKSEVGWASAASPLARALPISCKRLLSKLCSLVGSESTFIFHKK